LPIDEDLGKVQDFMGKTDVGVCETRRRKTWCRDTWGERGQRLREGSEIEGQRGRGERERGREGEGEGK